MGQKTAKWIFWGGTLASLALFLALTFDTHSRIQALTHADKLSDRVVAGKRAFEKYNCNDCHTILGFGGYYAPDLTRVAKRMGSDTIRRRLEHPEEATATSFRKMPRQRLAPQEVSDIVAFLRWVSEIDNHDWPPQDSPNRWKRSTTILVAGATLSPAAALVQDNCLACHSVGGSGGSRGPRLEWIGTRRDAAYIAGYLLKPPPGVNMPAFDGMTPAERESIADLIIALGAEGQR